MVGDVAKDGAANLNAGVWLMAEIAAPRDGKAVYFRRVLRDGPGLLDEPEVAM